MKEDGGGGLPPGVLGGDNASVHQGVRGAAGEQGLGVAHDPPRLSGLSHRWPW